MRDTRRTLRHGLLWLGSASVVVRVVDLAAIGVVLLFLRTDELGTASLAWTTSALLEAVSGLGLATALVQARIVRRLDLDSSFWFATGWALALVAGTSLVAPALAAFYGTPALAPMISVAALKLVALGMAIVPLQRLQRALRFRELGAVQVLSTLLAALLRMALAALGAGAWTLVIAHMMHGVFVLVVVNVIAPYRPRARFSARALRPLLGFGVKTSGAELVQQLYRNVDFLVVGKVLGASPLGLYRAAFDLAMEPALAIGDVVSRMSLPVLSRVATDARELRAAFAYTLRTLGLALLPVLIFLGASAPDLLAIVPGGRFVPAAGAMRVLLVAAYLRVLFQSFRPLFLSRGSASVTLALAVAALISLAIGLAFSIPLFASRYGILAASIAWAVSTPVTLGLSLAVARRLAGLGLGEVARAIGETWGVGLALAAVAFGGAALLHWVGASPPVVVAALALAIAGAFFALVRFGPSVPGMAGRLASFERIS